jgi:hypothetical protein
LAADAQKLDDFIQRHLTERILRQGMRFEQPRLVEAINYLGRQQAQGPDAALRQSIYWRGRLIQFGDASPQRIGQRAIELGRLPMDADNIRVAFMSVLDGSPGDSGVFSVAMNWAPIRAYVDSRTERDSSFPERYQVLATARGHDGFEWPFTFIIEVPKGFPSPSAWLSREDLVNFRNQ